MHFLIHRQDNYFQCGSEIGSCFLQVITIQLRFPYPLEINVQLIECKMFKAANIIMDIYILPCQKIPSLCIPRGWNLTKKLVILIGVLLSH